MTVLRSLQLEFVPVVHKLQRLRNAAIQIKMYLLSLQTENWVRLQINVISLLSGVLHISTVRLLQTCYIYCQVTADMLYLLSGYCRHVKHLTVLCQRLVTWWGAAGGGPHQKRARWKEIDWDWMVGIDILAALLISEYSYSNFGHLCAAWPVDIWIFKYLVSYLESGIVRIN